MFSIVRHILHPGVFALLTIITAWYAVIWLFDFQSFILPSPHSAVTVLALRFDHFMYHTMWTLLEAVAGFVLAIAISLPCAIAVVWSRFWDRSIMPILVATQTFPKVAIAPLLIIWFGFGLAPKIIVAFLVAYFPVVISLIVGMRSVESELVEIARSLKYSKIQIFTKVRIPYSLPVFFAGMKTAAAFALTGAVVGEWVGSDRGLGYLLIIANSHLDTRSTFAVLIILMVAGFLWFKLVDVIERLAIPWHVSSRADEVKVGSSFY